MSYPFTYCPHCGAELVEEQKIVLPAGCVCDPNEWEDPHNVLPVCNKFNGSTDISYCGTCGHDYKCHAEAHEQEETTQTKSL